MNVKTLVLLIAAACLTACGAQPETNAATPSRGQPATVRFVNVETGCWALELDTQRVQPVDLPEEFKTDGLAVSVELRDAPDMMTVCQVGPLKHIEHIEKR